MDVYVDWSWLLQRILIARTGDAELERVCTHPAKGNLGALLDDLRCLSDSGECVWILALTSPSEPVNLSLPEPGKAVASMGIVDPYFCINI
jgi:hypothetical protein